MTRRRQNLGAWALALALIATCGFCTVASAAPDPLSDADGDGQKTVLPATGNEWATLNYASGGKIGP